MFTNFILCNVSGNIGELNELSFVVAITAFPTKSNLHLVGNGAQSDIYYSFWNKYVKWYSIWK